MHWLRPFNINSKLVIGLAFALSLVTSSVSASNISFIRDTEIENAIRYYSLPIFNVAGLDARDVQIHIINDKRLNAFVSGGQQIFMNTGTLMTADDPSEVIGVIAHETGHITGGHLSQLHRNLENAQTQSIAALLLGIPLAILSGNGEVAAATLGLGSQIATRGLLSYTRANEEAADQAGITFLDEAGITSEGMLKFLERIHEQSKLYSDNQNPYIQTHPLTVNRVNFVKNHTQISRLTGKKMSAEFYVIHNRVRAKLIGFIEDFDNVFRIYPESNQSIPARYARAIAYKEHGEYDKSLAIIETLKESVPNDPFFYELEGDVNLDAARIEKAIVAFDKAIEILPWASLFHQAAGRARLETNDPEMLPEALVNLKEAVKFEPKSSSSWRLLATVYGKLEDFPNLAFALAEEAFLRNRLDTAIIQSEKAMDLLPRGSPKWLRAEDINISALDIQKKATDK